MVYIESLDNIVQPGISSMMSENGRWAKPYFESRLLLEVVVLYTKPQSSVSQERHYYVPQGNQEYVLV